MRLPSLGLFENRRKQVEDKRRKQKRTPKRGGSRALQERRPQVWFWVGELQGVTVQGLSSALGLL